VTDAVFMFIIAAYACGLCVVMNISMRGMLSGSSVDEKRRRVHAGRLPVRDYHQEWLDRMEACPAPFNDGRRCICGHHGRGGVSGE
jgi:hypothetical protein